jgi:hypothetical protein
MSSILNSYEDDAATRFTERERAGMSQNRNGAILAGDFVDPMNDSTD